MHITWKNLTWNDRAAKYFITSTRSFLFEAGAEVSDFSSYFYLLLKNLNYLNSLIRQKSECAKKNASYPIPITNRDVYLLEKILRDCDIYKRSKKNYVPVRQIFLGLEYKDKKINFRNGSLFKVKYLFKLYFQAWLIRFASQINQDFENIIWLFNLVNKNSNSRNED